MALTVTHPTAADGTFSAAGQVAWEEAHSVSGTATPEAHAASHESAGADALNVKNLGGFPGGTSTFLRADAAFATPATVAHAASHESVGSDALNVKNLAGYPGGTSTFLRADSTFAAPATLAHAASHESAGADALNVKNLGGYPGGTTTFLRADGAFATPTASAAVTQVATDPGSPSAGEVWVLAPEPSAGLVMGALGMTYASDNPLYYDLSYRTSEATTIRFARVGGTN